MIFNFCWKEEIFNEKRMIGFNVSKDMLTLRIEALYRFQFDDSRFKDFNFEKIIWELLLEKKLSKIYGDLLAV